jgi:hypothetical protein
MLATISIQLRAEWKNASFSSTEMVAQLLRTCVMILRTETARLVGAGSPGFKLAATLLDVDQRKPAVSTIKNSSTGCGTPLKIFGRKAVRLLHPFDR